MWALMSILSWSVLLSEGTVDHEAQKFGGQMPAYCFYLNPDVSRYATFYVTV